MKKFKLLLLHLVLGLSITSCYVEETVIVEDPPISLNQLLESYDLWYVDINSTQGFGETPFIQIAFTLSFRNGTLYANNNLVGIGSTGNGYGIDVGTYDAYDEILDIYHDIDGLESFDVYQPNNNTIELYNPHNDTSYFLEGYDRNDFDYDFVFYDNIIYFLQEYEAWEKTYASESGSLNEFDNENYLQFIPGATDVEFRSSQDEVGITNINNLVWDFEGIYTISDHSNTDYVKRLYLNYDYFEDEYFELTVLDDATIELFHNASGSTYEFEGLGFIQYREIDAKNKTLSQNNTTSKKAKKRKQRTPKKDNPRVPKQR